SIIVVIIGTADAIRKHVPQFVGGMRIGEPASNRRHDERAQIRTISGFVDPDDPGHCGIPFASAVKDVSERLACVFAGGISLSTAFRLLLSPKVQTLFAIGANPTSQIGCNITI